MFPVISITTGGPGANDHTFDVGFTTVPSAANVSVSGRVVTGDGRGIRNVIIYLTEANGTVHAVSTTAFGYYRFDEIESGQSVLVSAAAKRYRFSQPVRVVTLSDNVADLDFVAAE